MKKSQLRNIIRESIGELMTEQNSVPCCQMSVRSCSTAYGTTPGPWHSGGAWYQPNTNGGCPQKGDIIKITNLVGGPASGIAPYLNEIGFVMGVQQTQSFGPTCNASRTYDPLPATTQCNGCCAWTTGFGGPSGACSFNCGSTSAGSCNPAAWSNHANWTSTFTNTVANLNPNNPNQPCTFLNQKIAQFTSNLGGAGGAANIAQCKLDLANQLHTQNNC